MYELIGLQRAIMCYNQSMRKEAKDNCIRI